MKMILTDAMLDAAFKFRDTEPWAELADSDVFSVILSDGTQVYCSIMGHGGQHHSLGIYIGSQGFSTFLMTLEGDKMNTFEVLCSSTEFDCINCDFMQAKGLHPEVKKTIRDYAERHSLKIPRKHGWIDFTRHSPYHGAWCITDEYDAFVAEETLRAATFFVQRFNETSYAGVHLDTEGNYPTQAGGKLIPLITTDENGAYQISTTRTPRMEKRDYPVFTFDNDILIHKLKSLDRHDEWQCRMLHFPTPVHNEESEIPVLPGTFVTIDKYESYMHVPFVTSDYPANPKKLLTELANHMYDFGFLPEKIEVSDDKTFNMMTDFCRRCGIKLIKVKHMPQMDEASMAMLHDIFMPNPMMDLMLDF